jgi:IS5 family transposase
MYFLSITRANRVTLKEKVIRLSAKPLWSPSAVSIHLRLGERNLIEGKFGQAKNGYELNRIRARLKGTSETWIASIILVHNLVKLAGLKILLFPKKMVDSFSVNPSNPTFLKFLYLDTNLGRNSLLGD